MTRHQIAIDGMPLAWLPNQEGFRFIGVLADHRHVECVVEKDANGIHRVKGLSITQIIGWMAKRIR